MRFSFDFLKRKPPSPIEIEKKAVISVTEMVSRQIELGKKKVQSELNNRRKEIEERNEKLQSLYRALMEIQGRSTFDMEIDFAPISVEMSYGQILERDHRFMLNLPVIGMNSHRQRIYIKLEGMGKFAVAIREEYSSFTKDLIEDSSAETVCALVLERLIKMDYIK